MTLDLSLEDTVAISALIDDTTMDREMAFKQNFVITF